MSLVVGTIVWVVTITVLLGIVAYVLDRNQARREHKE